MATSEYVFVDQENQVPEGGLLAPKRGKARPVVGGLELAHNGSSLNNRAVLGEISQNIRQLPQQLIRTAKPAAQVG